jgi:hypothetical protein
VALLRRCLLALVYRLECSQLELNWAVHVVSLLVLRAYSRLSVDDNSGGGWLLGSVHLHTHVNTRVIVQS